MNTFTKYPYSNKLKNNLNKSLHIIYENRTPSTCDTKHNRIYITIKTQYLVT